jgi:hypothetical protein
VRVFLEEFSYFCVDQIRFTPKLSSCWFIQAVDVFSSVSIAFSTPILAISKSCLDFAFKALLE